jgi:hypothetical protein
MNERSTIAKAAWWLAESALAIVLVARPGVAQTAPLAPDARTAPSPASAEIKSATDSHAAHQFWSFQPINSSKIPVVKSDQWALTPIDRFILAKLEANGLEPNADADPHVLLRRVTFDLTGLPPTPEEAAAFLADQSPRAFASVVDRLLASPAFGERWARHWLDVVGYADQIGTSNDVPAPHAWRYRDYVIRAFNQDRPFDEFIGEQLAGDLLEASSPQRRSEQLTATGFLMLGHIDIVEADKAQLRMNVVDQQIDKAGKAFLGLTLGCARCHDHKFDPIPQRDYYALAGIFASTETTYVTDRGVWSGLLTALLPETDEEKTRRQHELQQHQQKVDQVQCEQSAAVTRKDEIERKLKELAEPGAKAEPASGPATAATPDHADESAALKKEAGDLAAKINQLQQQLWHLDYIRPDPPVAHALRDATQVADARITIRGNAHALGEVVPRGFVQVLSRGPAPAMPAHQSGRLQFAHWLTAPEQPLTARVAVNRIWQKLFGEGLVRSVDYFGVRSETPSHPELLDFLAAEFVRGGWSQKSLIRQIVLSRAYQMSSQHNARAATSDPQNRLLWRMNRRRLDAEEIRDSVLAVSGDLSRSTGGPALAPEHRENVGNLDPKDPNPVSFRLAKFRDGQERQRTIYLPIVRSMPQKGPGELLNFFDFAQPAQCSGQRAVTTVAPQALFLLNGPLLKQHAAGLADRILASAAPDDAARLARLYLVVLNRPITAAESREAIEFLTDVEHEVAATASTDGKTQPRREAWARFCHVLMASNEFLFRL